MAGQNAPGGPRFRYLGEDEKKSYLRDIGRLLGLEPEPALHAALYLTLRLMKMGSARGKDPETVLREVLDERGALSERSDRSDRQTGRVAGQRRASHEAPLEAPARESGAPWNSLSQTLEKLTSRLERLEMSGPELKATPAAPFAGAPNPAHYAHRAAPAGISSIAAGWSEGPNTSTPFTVVAAQNSASGAGGVGSAMPMEALLVKTEAPTRSDYRACRRSHRVLEF